MGFFRNRDNLPSITSPAAENTPASATRTAGRQTSAVCVNSHRAVIAPDETLVDAPALHPEQPDGMFIEITAVISDVGATQVVIRDRESIIVGRSADADVSVPYDASLSRLHFEIASTASGFLIRDLGSSNGTFVQGERISSRRLADREVIVAGQTPFVVRLTSHNQGDATTGALPDVDDEDCGRTTARL